MLKKMTQLLAACAMIAMSGCTPKEESRDYCSEVRSVDRLVLAQMTISKMATIDDIKPGEAHGLRQTAEALIDAVKIGDRKAAYAYGTYLRASIDLSGIRPEDVRVDEKARTITLDLPAVTTEYLGRDLGIREVHYRVTGLRSQIDAGERAALKEKMNTILKNEVEERPFFREKLIAQAKTKAAAFFQSLLGAEGQYTVIVNFKN